MTISDLQLPSGVEFFQPESREAHAIALADAVAAAIIAAIAEHGQAVIALSGGKSPVPFLQALSVRPLEWDKVTVTLADERWVPEDHPDSNARLLAEHLFQGPAAKARFVSLYADAADHYAAADVVDQRLASLPRLDVLVLGMGDDGHTASLFPASPGLDEALAPAATRRIVAMTAPAVPRERLSMTRALLDSAKVQLLAVQGDSKLATLRTALAGTEQEMPVRAFLRPPLNLYWCP